MQNAKFKMQTVTGANRQRKGRRDFILLRQAIGVCILHFEF
jgi:hypothetical protein